MIYTCPICENTFSSHFRLNAHKRKHSNYTQPPLIKCCAIISRQEIAVRYLDSHVAAFTKRMKICIGCGVSFIGKTQYDQYHNHSCAATSTNLRRERNPWPEDRKKAKEAKSDKFPYSPVFYNICAKTQRLFCSGAYKKFHPDLETDFKGYQAKCKFKFSVAAFPLWFDLASIALYGWYSTPGSRLGIKNLLGISRDHCLSQSEGFKLGISSKLLAHPANCELMQHNENQKKNIKSSITLDQLHERIRDFELLYPDWKQVARVGSLDLPTIEFGVRCSAIELHPQT